jgi:hypothetical protein
MALKKTLKKSAPIKKVASKKAVKKTVILTKPKVVTKKSAPKKVIKKVVVKKSTPIKKVVIKKTLPVVSKKTLKKSKVPVSPIKGGTQEEVQARLATLVEKGKKRRFVTYEEILKSFPDVEDDIMFLDDLYGKLHDAGIDVLESGSLLSGDALSGPSMDEVSGKRYDRERTGYDSIQMYLKEIGKSGLNASV